ncbi:acetylglutamate kinase [Gottfriedia solisilvae]|uniref:Acetylglutamate kinase n=1 Tax=Gottfriedia solisilvae TaxID=1516104 RepID=A0A8J3AHG4_9BACI|nr:acetylglutamate kinase [Gottfriedia solisilvae]GGI13403.1 acetylglutamate kinase [Gottfriedia solisilvae]
MGIVVIKLGGSLIQGLSNTFFEHINLLQRNGKKVIIVHGGGPLINNLLLKFSIPVEMEDGLRKTSNEVLEVVEYALNGKTNKDLVIMCNQFNLSAIGLSGCDNLLLEASLYDKGKLGWVGEVENVNTSLLELLLTNDYLPVISPIGVDKIGQKYNINADLAAKSIAKALNAEVLCYVTNTNGVLNSEGKSIEKITKDQVQALIESKTITDGMIPKVQSALDALDEVQSVAIVGENFLNEDGSMNGTVFTKGVVFSE